MGNTNNSKGGSMSQIIVLLWALFILLAVHTVELWYIGERLREQSINWLRVLGTTELAQIDQRVCQQLHAIMPQLDTFKTEQESLEFILPGKGALDAHPQRMNGGVEQAFASALRGLAVTGILFDVGNHAGIENALPIVRGIKTTIEVEVGAAEVQPDLFGHRFQRLQAFREQDKVGLIDR